MAPLASYYPSPIILPGLAGLLGLTGLAGGLYSLSAPTTVIKGFGLHPNSPTSAAASASSGTSAFQTALIRAYGVRNIGGGLTTLALTLAWFLEKDGMDKDVVKRCLGVVLITGPVVAFGDAWLVASYVRSGEVHGDAKEEGAKAAWGHVGAGMLIALAGGSLLLW